MSKNFIQCRYRGLEAWLPQLGSETTAMWYSQLQLCLVLFPIYLRHCRKTIRGKIFNFVAET